MTYKIKTFYRAVDDKAAKHLSILETTTVQSEILQTNKEIKENSLKHT